MTWRETTLGELCIEGGGGIQTGPFGSQLHASDYVLEGVPSVMPQNIGDNVIHEDGIARIQESDAQRLSKYRMRKGDIVYSRRGDVEKRALVRDANDGWLCGTGCLRVRLGDNSTHDPAFLSYVLGTDESREWIVRHAVGATMPNLNTSILSAVPLVVPAPMVQRAIAEVLGSLDDKIAANTKLSDTSISLLEANFAALGLNRDPESDEDVIGIDELVELNPKVSTPVEAEPIYVAMQKLPVSNMSISAWERRPAKGGARFMNGDTLLARITPCLENRKTGFVDFLDDGQVGIGSTEFIVLRSHAGIPRALSYFIATSERFRIFAIRHMVGTSGRQRVSALDLTGYSVGKPDEGALAEFGDLAATTFRLMKSLTDENRTLAATRDALLLQLMSGKLRVKDAEKVLEVAGV